MKRSLSCVVMLSLFVNLLYGAIAFIQAVNNTADSASVTINGVATGSALIAVFTWDSGSSQTLTGCTATGGTFSVGPQARSVANGQSAGMCYAPNMTSGNKTVAATFSATVSGSRGGMVAEYSGLATSSVNDGAGNAVVATASNATDGGVCGAVTPVVNGDLIMNAGIEVDGSLGQFTAGTGFTLRRAVTNLGGIVSAAMEEKIQTTAAGITPAFTTDATFTFVCMSQPFQVPSSGVTPVVRRQLVFQ